MVTFQMDLDLSKMGKKRRRFRERKSNYKKIPLQDHKTIDFSPKISPKENEIFSKIILDYLKLFRRFIISHK